VGRLRHALETRLGFEGIVGASAAMQRVFDLVERVAPTTSTVLITGESGTGKELVARSVHARSELRDREFLAINVAAIPAELVESYLFGHERGAFTGAGERREGLFRAARGGTVFLDEIGELAPPVQAKLLRVLESHEVFPVGSDRPVKAAFRLITATNQHLETLVERGDFRQDLFFRLNVFRVDLPPLRERREDVPALVEHLLARHRQSLGKRIEGTTNEAMRLLMDYPWPGNVRELSNVLERAALLCDEPRIGPEHLPAELRAAPPVPRSLQEAMEHFERAHITRILAEEGGNKEATARALGIHVATLYRRLEKLGLK